MALPEYVIPVVSTVGTPTLIIVGIRYSWQAVRAVLALVAGIAAIITKDDARRHLCITILNAVTSGNSGPPEPRSRRAMTRDRQASR